MPGQGDRSRRIALVIATSRYQEESLTHLRAPGTDAGELAEVLADTRLGGFEVQTLLDAPHDQLMRGVLELCSAAGPTDFVLVYLSCHGLMDDRGRLFYASTDTERRLLAATAISAAWLNEQLEDCRARSQILMLDCCHSGAFAKGAKGDSALALQDRFPGRGKVVLTASRATEYSFEGEEAVGQGVRSVFTRAIVEGLRTGDADINSDGVVTVTDLYQFLFDKVRELEPRQTPGMWTYGSEGDLVIARSVRIRPAPLPADIVAVLESPRPRIRGSGVVELAEILDNGPPELSLAAEMQMRRMAAEDVPSVAGLAEVALEAIHGTARNSVERRIHTRDALPDSPSHGIKEAVVDSGETPHAHLKSDLKNEGFHGSAEPAEARGKSGQPEMGGENFQPASEPPTPSVPEKETWWRTWIGAIVLMIVLGAGVVGIASLTGRLFPAEPSSTSPTSAPYTTSAPYSTSATTACPCSVVYEVEGTATAADLTLLTDTGRVQQTNQVLPLTDRSTGSRGIRFMSPSGNRVYISALKTEPAGSLSCRITVDGAVVSTNSGNSVATCSGFVP